MMLAAFGTDQVFWSLFWLALFALWFALAAYVVIDIIRSDTSGLAKAIWLLVVLIFPVFGVCIYMVANGSSGEAQIHGAAPQDFIRPR